MASIIIAAGVSAAVGFGSSLLINALTPAQVIDQGGLSDLSVPKSNYGAVIPQCWGEMKLAGNLLWSTAKREVTETKKQGGKGAPKVETKERTYFQSFALMFAYCPHRPVEALLQLYLSGELVYDSTATDPETIAASNEFASRYMRFYGGEATQNLDPLLQSGQPIQSYDYGLPHDATERANALTALGLDPNLNHVPAYRYKCYLVLENLPLADYGNQIPVVKANLRFNSNNSLETMVTDICNQVGVSNINTTGIANISVSGFYLDRIAEAKEALRTLQQAYFFDIIKSGDTLKFIAKAQERATISIPLSDLATHQGGQARPRTFELPRPNIEDLPESVEVSFLDNENGKEVGNVISRSQVAGSKRKESYNFPLLFTSAEAQAIADNLLHQFYLEAIKPQQLQLPPKYCYLEVGDRLAISFYGEPYILQISKLSIGANRLIKVDAFVVEAANISNISATPTPIELGGYNQPITQTQTIRRSGNTNLQVMDINLISDTDSDYGVYVSAWGGANWRECSIYVSNDNSSYYFVEALETFGTIGTLADNFDELSTNLLVSLDSGEFEAISTTDFDNGVNKLLVGNEILQFQNRSAEGFNEELSGLRRGIRGTENFINSHSIGERVILLSGNGSKIKRIPGTQADIGQVRYLKAPSPGQTLDQAPVVAVTIAGNALKPYSPGQVTGTVDNIGNITLNWERRDRRAGNATTFENEGSSPGVSPGVYEPRLPLSELEEKWEVDILNGSTVVRTLSSIKNAVVYSSSDQTTNFGSPQSTISVRIYQISAIVGRGYPTSATVTPVYQDALPVINSFTPISASVGDLITVTGSGLSGINEARVNGVAQDNLSVTGDSQFSFIVAQSATTGLIEAVTSGGVATSASALIISNNLAIPRLSGVVAVNASRTISDSDLGQMLAVDTTSGNITLTLNENLLSSPSNFTFAVQKVAVNNEVSFQGNGSNTIFAPIGGLVSPYQGLRFYYDGNNNWYSF